MCNSECKKETEPVREVGELWKDLKQRTPTIYQQSLGLVLALLFSSLPETAFVSTPRRRSEEFWHQSSDKESSSLDHHHLLLQLVMVAMAASITSPSASILLQRKLNPVSFNTLYTKTSPRTHACHLGKGKHCLPSVSAKATGSLEGSVAEKETSSSSKKIDYGAVGVHHVGILCENLERSLDFYQNILGLDINEARPHDKLPYRGAWLWIGSEMIHLMELPNPDPLTGRPTHGGRDRHTCIAIRNVSKLKEILDEAGIPYTLSKSGRPAIFTRDPDANALEFTQI